MRNLKRVLSLSLASVMLLGMMVIGSSAATDYSDVDYSEDNVEAIEVLQAINVMTGDLDNDGNLAGTFRPGDEVSRAEMARIMAALMDLDYDYYIGANPFTDMVGHWAEGYAAACAANGIIYGRTATTYDPATTVTAVEAASMLMRALGYFQNPAVDQPDGFVISTIRQAGKIDLFKNVDVKTDEPMTRNDVAQLVLNTLQSGMVEPDSSSRVEVTVGDAQVALGSTNYVYVVGRDTTVATSINETTAERGNSSTGLSGPILDLGEKLYDGKLKLNKNKLDVFGRPSRQWEFDGAVIGTYTKDELLANQFVGSVTGKDLYDLLGSTVVEDYDVYAYIDGLYTDDPGVKEALDNAASTNPRRPASAYFNVLDMNKNNKDTVGGTGVGVVTEVYVDHDKDKAYVSVINTYLAIADDDYDDGKESVSLSVYAINKDNINLDGEYVKMTKYGQYPETIKVDVDDIPSIVDIVENEVLLVTVAEGEIQTIQPAQALEGVTISSFKLRDNVVADGATYKYTTTAGYKWEDDINTEYTTTGITNLKDRTYNIYLDNYDNLIGIEEVEAVNNYVFITGIDLNGSYRANQTADASAIFLDGYMGTIKVNMTKSTWRTPPTGQEGDSILNTWCTYSVSGDVYTLTEVADVGVTQSGGAAGQYAMTPDDTGDKLAQFNQTSASGNITIDSKNYRMYGGGASGSAYYNVYGDSDTVYLTVELGELQVGANPWTNTNYGIIRDVVSVSVGAENADLVAWGEDVVVSKAEDKPNTVAGNINTTGQCASGIYGLYNNKGLIVAAIVVGEDAGSAKDLVYVHSSGLEGEEYNGDSTTTTRASGDGQWTWTRYVIRDGEEVLLTEVGDKYNTGSSLANMDRYHWYQVTTNSNGEVMRAVLAANNNAIGPKYTGGASTDTTLYVEDYQYINDAVEKNTVKTVLYITDGGPIFSNGVTTNGFDGTQDLEIKGTNILAVTHEDGSGIKFRDDVNVVLQYYEKNKLDATILTGHGKNKLQSMIDIVNDNNAVRGNNNYFLSALIEDGRATTIVIYDSYNSYSRPEASGTTYLMDVNASVSDVNEALATYGDVTIRGDWEPDTSDGVYGLKLPANSLLTVKGDFDAIDAGVTVNVDKNVKTGGAKLVVEGAYTMSNEVSSAINYNIDAETMAILQNDKANVSGTARQSRGVTINSTVVVEEGLTIQNATEKTAKESLTTDAGVTVNNVPKYCDVIVSENATLTVEDGGIIGMGANGGPLADATTAWIKVLGTLNVDEDDIDVSVYVQGHKSLHAFNSTIGGVLVLNDALAEFNDADGGIYNMKSTDEIVSPNGVDALTFKVITAGLTVTTKATASSQATETVQALDNYSGDGEDAEDVFGDASDAEATAKIGSTTVKGNFVSLVEMVEEAGSGTITLNDDVDLTDYQGWTTDDASEDLNNPLVLASDITLNLNGYNITGKQQMLVIGDGTTSVDVTIKSGSLTQENGSGWTAIKVEHKATLTIDDVDVTCDAYGFGVGAGSTDTECRSHTGAANLIIKNGSVVRAKQGHGININNLDTVAHNIEVTNSEIKADAAEGSIGIFNAGKATVTVTNSKVSGDSGIAVKGGTLTVKGSSTIEGITKAVTLTNLNAAGAYAIGPAIAIYDQSNVTNKYQATVNLDALTQLKVKDSSDPLIWLYTNNEESARKTPVVKVGTETLTAVEEGAEEEYISYILVDLSES